MVNTIYQRKNSLALPRTFLHDQSSRPGEVLFDTSGGWIKHSYSNAPLQTNDGINVSKAIDSLHISPWSVRRFYRRQHGRARSNDRCCVRAALKSGRDAHSQE